MVKVGVLGGTLDPVHNGHLIIARETMKARDLSRIIFIPAADQWLKRRRVSPAEDRVNMVRLAIEDQPGFELSRLDVDRPGPTYTVDTLTDLRRKLDQGEEINFMLGWDGLAMFPRWREPRRIIELCQILAIPRPGAKLPDVKALEEAVPGISRRLVLLDRPLVDISSSDIRRRVALGLPFEHLVPPGIARYIKERGLYLKEEESAEGGI